MSELIPWAVGLLAVIGTIIAGYFRGKQSARNEQQANERKAIDKAKDVDNEINQASDDDINRRLTSWVRGGKR